MRSDQSMGRTKLVGIGAIVLTILLAVAASFLVVKKLNDNADAALRAAMSYQPVGYSPGGGSSAQQVPVTQPVQQNPVVPSDDGGQEPDGLMVPDDTKEPEQEDSGNAGTGNGASQEAIENQEESSPAEDASEGSPEDSPEGSQMPVSSSDDSNSPTENTGAGSAGGSKLVGLEWLALGEDGTAVYHILWGNSLEDIASRLGDDVSVFSDPKNYRDANLVYAQSMDRTPLSQADIDALGIARQEEKESQAPVKVNTGPDESLD